MLAPLRSISDQLTALQKLLILSSRQEIRSHHHKGVWALPPSLHVPQSLRPAGVLAENPSSHHQFSNIASIKPTLGFGSRFCWRIEAGLETVLRLDYLGYGITQESLCCLMAPSLGSPPACHWQASSLKPECGSMFPGCAGP